MRFDKLIEEASVQSLTTCFLSVVVCSAVSWMAIQQIPVPDWFLIIASGVFASHFTSTVPKMANNNRSGTTTTNNYQ